MMKHFKARGISEDWAGKFYPSLSELILMINNMEYYRGKLLLMIYIRCYVCKRYKYRNRYGKIVYNRSVICPICKKKGHHKK